MMGGRAGEVQGQNVDVGIGIYTLIIKGAIFYNIPRQWNQ